jgi:hypothetical protein
VAEKIGEGLKAIPPVFDLHGPYFAPESRSWIRINHAEVSRAKLSVTTKMNYPTGLLI